MTESKHKSETLTNGSSIADGVLVPSTESSPDNGSNAWSIPGTAAFDFRSASSPEPAPTYLKLPIRPS